MIICGIRQIPILKNQIAEVFDATIVALKKTKYLVSCRALHKLQKTIRNQDTNFVRKKTMAKVVGIDLGTTNSTVSVIMGGDPEIIPTAEGEDGEEEGVVEGEFEEI